MSLENSEIVKKEFAHLETNYFNSAYFGPSPYRAKQKVSTALFKELDPSFFPYNTWMGIPDRLRFKIKEILNCPADNIAHSTSCSDIVNIVANGFPFKKNDSVCAINGDYPSNILPWMLAKKNRGIELNLLQCELPDVDFLKKNLPANTKIFNISHVAFDTGRKIDLKSIGKFLKERDIFFIVDATQSLGGVKITSEELSYIDVLACSSYKWMLGPYGHAFAYFSDRALSLVEHHHANWINSPNSKVVYHLLDYTIDTLPGARKFDRGQAANMLIMAALEGSLDLLNELKLENIEKHNQEIRDFFLDNYPKDKYQIMTPKDAMGNIISLKAIKLDSVALEAELKHRNIDVSVREGKIRLSFHLFNNKKQVSNLIKGLDI